MGVLETSMHLNNDIFRNGIKIVAPDGGAAPTSKGWVQLEAVYVGRGDCWTTIGFPSPSNPLLHAHGE